MRIIVLQAIANVTDTNSSLLSSFASPNAIKFWQDCCNAATDCCKRMINARRNKLTKEVQTSYSKTDPDRCESMQGN